MKLATYQDGSRDGQLVVVSRDGASAHYASGIATRLQQVLDDWNFLSPQLEDLSVTLNHGRARHAFAFDARHCMAPLPRAYQRVLAAPDAAGDAPLLLHGSGCGLLGAADAGTAQMAGGVAVLAAISGDLPAGATPERALEGVRLLLLGLAAQGAAAFAPLALTPDELGAAWRGGRVHATLTVRVDRRHDGRKQAPGGAAMPWHFGELLAALAGRAPVGAGSIVACGLGELLPPGELQIEIGGADGYSLFGTLTTAAAGAGHTAPELTRSP